MIKRIPRKLTSKKMEETKYTKSEIIYLVKTELIKSFGGLAQDSNGVEIDTPYVVLGVLYEAIPNSKQP